MSWVSETLGCRKCKLDKHEGQGRQETSLASGLRVFLEIMPNDELEGKQGGWRLKSVSRMACDLTGRATAYTDANKRS